MLDRVGTFGQQMKPLGRNNGAHFLITGIFLGAARCSLYKKSTKLPGAAFMPSPHRADLLQRVRQASFALFLQALAVFLKLESLVEFVA
jgi:hypothetical protein